MSLNFKINGKPYEGTYTINALEFPVDMTLNTFIREHAMLPATKFMCLEGGCGVCICVIKRPHPKTGEIETYAANSCLTLLQMCDGWEVLTSEGIGNKKDGYHPIQTRLAEANGTQCGYCSPGMVMNMYGLLKANNGNLTTEEIEDSFGGNICRCTGYRPILDAMKSFAINSEYDYIESKCNDIEDFENCCLKNKLTCRKIANNKFVSTVHENIREWVKANSVQDIFDEFARNGEQMYMLVAGNTAHGVYRRHSSIKRFIDINNVAELHEYTINGNKLELGGNLSLTKTMLILKEVSKTSGFEYCTKVVRHIDLVANIPVRNMGTIAGNLSIKHQYREFPSDIFLLLDTLNAEITIRGLKESYYVSPIEYLETNMKNKIITKITLDARPVEDFVFDSYKIMPRAQNAHAYVNAGFLLQKSEDEDVVISARLCFGGIDKNFHHASKAEDFLINKKLFSNSTIQGVMKILFEEMNPDWTLPDASPEYRKILACNILYKFIISIASPQSVHPKFKSAGELLNRPLSNGTQIFDTREDMYPITKPLNKIDGLVQCSGEAFYMNDLPPMPQELWAAFVHAIQANSKIATIDASEALSVPGVVAFFSAKDIPGKNSFVLPGLYAYYEDEQIFCDDEVRYHSQPVGLIVAESLDLAKMASGRVKIMYEKPSQAVMATLQDVIENKALHRIRFKDKEEESRNSDDWTIVNTTHIQGNLDLGSQFHFTMEPQTCVCVPCEAGLSVYSACQWMDFTQGAISNCLNMKKSKIFVQVRRIGGGYGGKISRSVQIACACALASVLLNRPIRFVQSIESMMSCLGKRNAVHSDYEVDFDGKGKILKLKNKFYEDCGSSVNECPKDAALRNFKNCYDTDSNWVLDGSGVLTDAPSHTFCRAPGSLEGIAMIETIMEHVAFEANIDPVEVRLQNLRPHNKLGKLIPDFLASVEYDVRKNSVADFNIKNRWRKKGLGFSVMQYPVHYFGIFTATVSIYHGDGSVSISHGGIEMGQGLNTKVSQVAAYVLKVPIDIIRIHPSDSFNGANSVVTGGGIGSESLCYAVKKSCEELLLRMKPFHENSPKFTWEDWVQKSHIANVCLTATHSHKKGDLQQYDVYGLCLTETEVDVLTGNLLITRVDLLEDTGESLSPAIDIGQIEGAFVMGIGYWLTEKLVYNRQNGELLTNRTWTYKTPGAKDIPIDFRITLLQKSPNEAGFLRSKATGEPAATLAVSVIFAIRQALNSSRADAGIGDKWFQLGAPTTPEEIVLNSGNTLNMLKLI